LNKTAVSSRLGNIAYSKFSNADVVWVIWGSLFLGSCGPLDPWIYCHWISISGCFWRRMC
jgi:hypothetical protein